MLRKVKNCHLVSHHFHLDMTWEKAFYSECALNWRVSQLWILGGLFLWMSVLKRIVFLIVWRHLSCNSLINEWYLATWLYDSYIYIRDTHAYQQWFLHVYIYTHTHTHTFIWLWALPSTFFNASFKFKNLQGLIGRFLPLERWREGSGNQETQPQRFIV